MTRTVPGLAAAAALAPADPAAGLVEADAPAGATDEAGGLAAAKLAATLDAGAVVAPPPQAASKMDTAAIIDVWTEIGRSVFMA
ncbi:MAG TPA: hypothetical protein VMW62_06230 [Chloroflexota bacterium]|nr:hypothetical protein [Chloroflexota bacterium]